MTVKHRKLLLQNIDESEIIDEEMGNNRYVAITKDSVYFVSIGIQSGTFFGKKVKSFPIKQITSVDISKKVLASYLEISGAGFGGHRFASAGYTENNENVVFFPNNKTERFQELVKKIRNLMTKSDKSNTASTESDEIQRFYELMKKGIITQDEFEKKKKQIIG